MEILWFCTITFMIVMYVVLDGFDIGVGILLRIIGKTESERDLLIKSIGPVWDGNEVWLLAAGGILFFAFPKLYASSFSGFYLPLIIVLWLLIARGVGIEFRHLINNQVWKSFWEYVFSLASILLSIFFGVALGNVVRGVPLNPDGYFFEPLWTTFTVVPDAGIIDWFTIIIGLVAFFTLTSHGANYIAMKTEGIMQQRARYIAKISWWGILLMSIAAIIAVTIIHTNVWKNFSDYPLGMIFPLSGFASLAGMFYLPIQKKDIYTFVSSSIFIASMLSATAFGLFPNLLYANSDPNYSITIYNASTNEYGLKVGFVWWSFGIILTSFYFVYLYRSFRGKVEKTTADIEY